VTAPAGKQPAPRSLIDLMIAIEGLEAPDDVFNTIMSIRAAIFDKNPRAALSKRCCRLREARPGVFREVWRWLMTSEVKNSARRVGAIWAWRAWCKACAAIDRGVKPHVAFGMDKPGRPVDTRFSHTDDVYMLADHLNRQHGMPIETAGQNAAEAIGVTMGDIRTLRRGMVTYRGSTPDEWRTGRGLLDDLRLKYPRMKKLNPPKNQE
jgi:hypothetical protein